MRHALVRTLRETALPVRGSRGFAYAEVTAGGVPLDEVDSATMESRLCPNLFFTGEILDVDGRLGGFNFQWAWSSAWVAAQAIARVIGPPEGGHYERRDTQRDDRTDSMARRSCPTSFRPTAMRWMSRAATDGTRSGWRRAD